jgi:hypothetical protein
MLFDLTRNIVEVPKVKSVNQSTCPPFRKYTIEINRNDREIGALPIRKGECND